MPISSRYETMVGGTGFSAGSQAFMLGDGRSAAALPISRAAGGEPF